MPAAGKKYNPTGKTWSLIWLHVKDQHCFLYSANAFKLKTVRQFFQTQAVGTGQGRCCFRTLAFQIQTRWEMKLTVVL